MGRKADLGRDLREYVFSYVRWRRAFYWTSNPLEKTYRMDVFPKLTRGWMRKWFVHLFPERLLDDAGRSNERALLDA